MTLVYRQQDHYPIEYCFWFTVAVIYDLFQLFSIVIFWLPISFLYFNTTNSIEMWGLEAIFFLEFLEYFDSERNKENSNCVNW